MEKAEQVGADLGAINAAIMAPFSGVAGEYAGIGGGQITVDHDTVLQAGKIIQDQVDQLNRMVRPKLMQLMPGDLGKDDVSLAAGAEWAKILAGNPDSYVERIGQYIDGLENLAQQMKTAAQQYGFTEEQIKDAFGAQG
jgi:hypothetical protein